MSDLRAELLEAFRAEHREYLEGLRTLVASAEPNLEEAYRLAHSLKSAARVCDLGPVEELAARLEALFARARSGALALGAESRSAVRQAADAIEGWFAAMEAGVALPETRPALEAVDRLLTPARPASSGSALSAELLEAFQVEHREHLAGIRAVLASLEAGSTGPAAVEEAFRLAHSLKGVARIAELRGAEKVAHQIESLFARARDGAVPLDVSGPEVLRTIHAGLNYIEDAATCLLQGRPPPDPAEVLRGVEQVLDAPSGVAASLQLAGGPIENRPPQQAAETVRVRGDHLDGLLRSVEQLLTEGLGQDRLLGELRQIDGLVRELARDAEQARSTLGADLDLLGESASLAWLARYLGRVEEQVRDLSQRLRQVVRSSQQGAWSLRQLGGQLWRDVRQVRTVPAESVLGGFRKMMRDLARDQGKEIDFQVCGLDVQADRLVLQALKDPLMHVLRNAVSHGVEPPQERVGRGKRREGRVALLLEVDGPRLRVRVEDDGRGIDTRAVVEEGVRRGLLPAECAKGVGPGAETRDLTALLFRPGFSTACAVTDLAGRGIGLSVVHQAVTRLGGEVQLHTLGQGGAPAGTVVEMSVPLSVSAQRLLLVSCRGQTFAVPTHAIESLRRVRSEEIQTVVDQRVLFQSSTGLAGRVRGAGGLVPLHELGDLLGLVPDEQEPDPRPVLLVRSGARGSSFTQAVAVDALLGERQALVKDLDAPAAGERWAGAILREDGSVCLVLNPAGLFQRAGEAPARKAPVSAGPAKRASSRGPATILVVDDSLTTRTLEKSILEAHGYRVRLALDGLEALDALRDDLPELVITDIQMPRLDGFGLLERMKQDPRLKDVPVIVVSSLDRIEDQERGLTLGADAYIGKRKFDHEELLQVVRQIIL